MSISIIKLIRLLLSLTLIGCYCSLCSCSLFEGVPSDTALEENFFRNESDFNKLAQMSNQDWHVVRITSGFTWLDTDASWPRADIGFSTQRWDEYRKLFRKLGIEAGISRRKDHPSSIFVIVSGSGVLGGTDKGYVYSPRPLSPVLQSLNKMPSTLYDAHHYAIAFKPIAKDWYLYREED